MYLRFSKGDEVRRLDKATGALDRDTFGRQVVGVDGGEEGGGGDILKVVPWLEPEEASRGFLNIGVAFLKARTKELLTLALEICPQT